MSEELYLKIGNKTLERLDQRRGDLKRDEYILRVLEEHMESDGQVKIRSQNSSNESGDTNSNDLEISILTETLQAFAKDIYKRLDKLEEKINDLPDEIVVSVESDLEKIENKKSIDDDSERKKIFKFPGEDQADTSEDVIFEVADDEFSDDISSEDSTGDSEFEYGCPYCNATIPENAAQCPKCGAHFDDLDNQYAEVEPLSEGYSSSSGYDPRPNYVKHRDYGVYSPGSGHRDFSGPPPKGYDGLNRESISNPPRRAPICMNCSGNLVYIDDIKRWYCYRCNKYFGGPPSGADTRDKQNPIPRVTNTEPYRPRTAPGNQSIRSEEYPPKDNKPRETKRPRDPNWRPLKGYHRYTD